MPQLEIGAISVVEDDCGNEKQRYPHVLSAYVLVTLQIETVSPQSVLPSAALVLHEMP